MIGTIAGDIIGSPYVHNMTPDTSSIFFPLFASSDKVEIDGGRARTRTYKAAPSVLTGLAEAASQWFLRTDRSADAWASVMADRLGEAHPSGTQALAVCGPIAKLSANENEALRLVGTIMGEMKPGGDISAMAAAWTRVLWGAGHGKDVSELKAILADEGLDVNRNCSEIRPFITGSVIMDDKGHLSFGEGKTVRDCSEVLPAAFAAFTESGSFEEVVRRAVAVGGDSSLGAALAGALAEMKYEVPELIKTQAKDFLSETERGIINGYERAMKVKVEGVDISDGVKDVNGAEFSVIRMEGMPSIYVVPEGRKDIETAIKKVAKKTQAPYEIIRSNSEASERLAALSAQRDSFGRDLTGTYLEHPRPELKKLWLQGGEIRTAFTREGVAVGSGKLPSKSKRLETFNKFQQLKEHVRNVRSELEKGAGFDVKDLASGQHVHFASAYYPVVLDHSIEIWQGDILRGRAGINEGGRFVVDTNALTGGFHSEGIEGVLATMNIFTKGMDMDAVREAVDRVCLDYGKIESEEERISLEEDDAGKVYDEARAIRKIYASNVDVAHGDASAMKSVMIESTGEELYPSATMPVLTEKAAKAAELREERRAESEERYKGAKTQREALDSVAHKGSVFTIGHSNLKEEEFDALLKRHGIEVVVDVRSFTSSKFNPQFNKDTLDDHLYEKGVEYYHFPSFGEKQYEGGGKDKRRLSFEEIMAKPEFKADMKRLRECVKNGNRVVLMSSEGDPMESHRMAMLGRALEHPEVYGSRAKPIDVQHITRQGYVLSQEHFERKLMDVYLLKENPDAHRELQAAVMNPDMGVALAVSGMSQKDMKDIVSKDPTYNKRLSEAYRMRGAELLKGGSEKISLRRNMMKAEAKKHTKFSGKRR